MKVDQRDDSETVFLDPCLLYVACRGSGHLCGFCCIDVRVQRGQSNHQRSGLEWRSGGLEPGPAVPVGTSLPKVMQDQSIISVIISSKPRPEQSPHCRNKPHCWHSGPIPKLCCASRCHLRPLLEKVVWMWMAPQMVPNLTKIQFNGFPTWQWSESNIHLAETVLRILNCDLLLGYRYIVQYFSMILAGHTHDYKGE